MQLQQASRKKARIKLGIQSPSGGGKTMSALLIAYGLCGNWSKIAVIDTENKSADLYAHLGEYKTLSLEPPYSPERYIEGIDICLDAGIEVIVIDSTSHEWDNLLDYHSSLQGNSFTNWARVTPRHEAFVNKILQSNAHFICTIRSKTDYVLSEKNGKQVPEKVGLKAHQRDNLEYEFTLVFEMNMAHMAKASKDRTGLFMGKPEFVPTVETGRAIAEWCSQGIDVPQGFTYDQVLQLVRNAQNISELNTLYYTYPQYQQALRDEFTTRKLQIQNNIIHQTNQQ
ncbi:MAG: AAA family ATPase [Flavipsychrobacter sp.]|nr:AAA family ATPase [Flavipsychrobacter sp.]